MNCLRLFFTCIFQQVGGTFQSWPLDMTPKEFCENYDRVGNIIFKFRCQEITKNLLWIGIKSKIPWNQVFLPQIQIFFLVLERATPNSKTWQVLSLVCNFEKLELNKTWNTRNVQAKTQKIVSKLKLKLKKLIFLELEMR